MLAARALAGMDAKRREESEPTNELMTGRNELNAGGDSYYYFGKGQDLGITAIVLALESRLWG